MHYLIFAIICSSSIALLFKITEQKNLNRYAVTLFNYAAASVISIYFLMTSPQNLLRQITTLEFIILAVIGSVTGFLFYFSFILYQQNIKNHGASITGMFVKLGILIPMLISVVVWQEYPSIIQTIAIISSLGAIILVNLNFKKASAVQIKMSLILLFFVGGMAEFANKIFQNYFSLEYKPLFLLFVFLSAFFFSYIKLKKEDLTITPTTVTFGLIIGFFNLFSSFFLIESLAYVKTSIAFALFSSVSMSLILIVSYLFFKETLKTKDKFAITITIISLFIINLT